MCKWLMMHFVAVMGIWLSHDNQFVYQVMHNIVNLIRIFYFLIIYVSLPKVVQKKVYVVEV